MRYLLVLFIIFSCRSANTSADLEPLCMQETVENILGNPPLDPRSEIKQGVYKNNPIYVYTEKRGATEFAIVLNFACEYICEVGGAEATANCPADLFESLKDLELIWIDPR